MNEDPCLPNGLFRYDIPANPKLTAEGWVRRYLADPIRAREAVELYGSLGFEVRQEKLLPSDFGENCDGCPSVVCDSYVMIYTRKLASDAAEDDERGGNNGGKR
jgi:hypothetical protein